jgi:TolB-like protein
MVVSKPSIAVLPFMNMSSAAGEEYFSDGITEEIINSLANIEGLHVTARTSSFAFKNMNVDVREIGKQLNVSLVLEGSVRKIDNQVRITAQLIRTSDGYHIWSSKWDRQLNNIFILPGVTFGLTDFWGVFFKINHRRQLHTCNKTKRQSFNSLKILHNKLPFYKVLYTKRQKPLKYQLRRIRND